MHHKHSTTHLKLVIDAGFRVELCKPVHCSLGRSAVRLQTAGLIIPLQQERESGREGEREHAKKREREIV